MFSGEIIALTTIVYLFCVTDGLHRIAAVRVRADRIGILIRSLFAQIGKQLAMQILNPSNQQKAYEFAKAIA